MTLADFDVERAGMMVTIRQLEHENKELREQLEAADHRLARPTNWFVEVFFGMMLAEGITPEVLRELSVLYDAVRHTLGVDHLFLPADHRHGTVGENLELAAKPPKVASDKGANRKPDGAP